MAKLQEAMEIAEWYLTESDGDVNRYHASWAMGSPFAKAFYAALSKEDREALRAEGLSFTQYIRNQKNAEDAILEAIDFLTRKGVTTQT